ncbi:MAG: hypothetical protein WC943_13380 [Elusimicrobiota bacterium]|jgi:hypothetical protein
MQKKKAKEKAVVNVSISGTPRPSWAKKDPLCGVFIERPHESGRHIPIVSAKDRKAITGWFPNVNAPSGYKLVPARFEAFLSELKRVGLAELAFRRSMKHVRVPTKKGELGFPKRKTILRAPRESATKRERISSRFLDRWGTLVEKLWQPVHGKPYFDPLYFPRDMAGRKAFNSLVDVVNAMFGRLKGGSTGATTPDGSWTPRLEKVALNQIGRGKSDREVAEFIWPRNFAAQADAAGLAEPESLVKRVQRLRRKHRIPPYSTRHLPR